MTQRRRRSWAVTAIGSAVLAIMTLLAIQGCDPAAPADAVTRDASHDLTIADARAVYQKYLTVSDVAAAQDSPALGLSDLADAQWTQVHAQYTALASAGTPVPRYRYGTPVFYVPALDSYPHWFMVTVPRRASTGGPAARTLLVFEQYQRAKPWTLNGQAVLGRPLPPLALDRDGYAVDVSTTDPSLLMRPDVVPPTQAAVVDDGPASPAASVVAPGPLTTGLYAAQAARARAAAARGVQYQWLLQGTPFPQFQLRTADGGALVLYGMYLDTTTEHRNLAAGTRIPVPPGFGPLLAAPTEIGYHAVYADWTYQFAAIDPPAKARNAKLQVIASQGAPTYGHAY